MTGNFPTENWNQQNGNKENNTKNQWNKKQVHWEYQQNRQTLLQTNQKAERKYQNK